MKKERIIKLSQEIEDVSSSFEDNPFTENIKFLKEAFDINSVNTPKYYSEIIDELEEVIRETRLLFLFSVFNKVCVEDGKVYNFDEPFQAGMRYEGVMKKEGEFYLLDEDGGYREIFTSEKFTKFMDDLYWEVYE